MLTEKDIFEDKKVYTNNHEYINQGYVLIRKLKHPYRNKNRYVRKHRVVVEEHLTKINGIKTYLHPSVHIHHKDGNRQNNEISNLQILSNSEHRKLHGKNRKK